MKKVFAFVMLSALILTGCRGVKTGNYTESKSLYYIASDEKKSPDFPAKKCLLVFVTESKTPISFSLSEKNKPESKAAAKIDKDAFAAFVVNPGEYIFQTDSLLHANPGEIIIFQCSVVKTIRISTADFKENFRGINVSEECSGTDSITPAHLIVPDLVGDFQRLGYYSGRTAVHVIASPFYVLYGTCFFIGCSSLAAMHSGHLSYMLGGALFYSLTFWAVPDDVKETLTANSDQYFEERNSTGINSSVPVSTKSSSSLGPGIYQDQYGRPVKYKVENGVPGEQLQIKHDAYGPGVGMDQYGRPVHTVPAY